MKKILFALMFLGKFVNAQDSDNNNLFSLQSVGLNALLDTKGKFDSEVSMESNDEAGMKIYKIKFNDGNKLQVSVLNKPMTGAVMMQTVKDLAKKKQNGATIKIISQNTKEVIIERTMGKAVIYKCYYITMQKGKEYLISSDEAHDLQTAKELMVVAKSFTLN
jgi:uncharacterized protein YjdB